MPRAGCVGLRGRAFLGFAMESAAVRCLCAVLLFGQCSSEALAASNEVVVAVFDIERREVNLKPATLKSLVDLVETRLTESGRFKVVPRSDIRSALRAKQRESYQECYEERCQIEVGKELAAQKTLATRVARLGSSCQVTIKLYDLRSGTADAGRIAKGPCDVDGVVRSLEAALLGLLGGRKTQTVTPKPKKDPPPKRDYASILEEAQAAEAEAKAAKAQAEKRRQEEAARVAKAKARAEALRKRAETEAQQRRQAYLKRIEADWKQIEAIIQKKAFKRMRRIAVLEQFMKDYKDNNPYRGTAEGYIRTLKKGLEPVIVGVMVEVPAGAFIMGCQEIEVEEDQDYACDERDYPIKRAHLEAFHIDRTEVTVAQYKRCVDAGVCKAPAVDKLESTLFTNHCTWQRPELEARPINCINWHEADAYCKWAKKRLPTAMEWEKAARGVDGRPYPWGAQKLSCQYAVINESGGKGISCGQRLLGDVGSMPAGASPYGALDMIGSVSEWTADSYVSNKFEYRATRGGSYFSHSYAHLGWLTTFERQLETPDFRSHEVGVRCASAATP